MNDCWDWRSTFLERLSQKLLELWRVRLDDGGFLGRARGAQRRARDDEDDDEGGEAEEAEEPLLAPH